MSRGAWGERIQSVEYPGEGGGVVRIAGTGKARRGSSFTRRTIGSATGGRGYGRRGASTGVKPFLLILSERVSSAWRCRFHTLAPRRLVPILEQGSSHCWIWLRKWREGSIRTVRGVTVRVLRRLETGLDGLIKGSKGLGEAIFAAPTERKIGDLDLIQLIRKGSIGGAGVGGTSVS